MPDIPPLHYLVTLGPRFFAFDFGRYLVFATLISALVWVLARTRLAPRMIQQRRATAADRRREFRQSLGAVVTYSVVGAFIVWGERSGVLHRMPGSYGWAGDLAVLAALILAHDTYFYWAHRAMHHRRLFRLFHRAHHRSITPTPWAAYSFAVPEALVMIAFVPLWLVFVPTPGWVMLAWLMFQLLRNTMGHAGFEFMPRWWLASPLTRWINTTTHHDLHHAGGFNTNYGLYFTWWDRWMGTEHPHYAARFADVVGRTAPAAATGRAGAAPTTDPAPAT